MTRPEDVQSIYDALPVEDREPHWIEGATRRFDGYNLFGEYPEIPIDRFNSHVGSPASPGLTRDPWASQEELRASRAIFNDSEPAQAGCP